MKKISLLLSFFMIVCAVPVQSFAADAEKQYLEESAETEVIEAFIEEKIDEAIEILNDDTENSSLTTLEDGQEYLYEVYDLGDDCLLIVELEDRAEGEVDGIATCATSGSNTLWKEYGKRYFTASATVTFSFGYATMKLRNHYTLSSKGIDERYGVALFSYDVDDGSMSATEPEITDSVARTVGASDVNMECQFTLNYTGENGYAMKKKYKMKSTVGFVDINTTDEKVKVKQSWSLTKLS